MYPYDFICHGAMLQLMVIGGGEVSAFDPSKSRSDRDAWPNWTLVDRAAS